MTMRVEEVTSFSKFIKLQNEWNKLLQKCECDSVFLRHEWFKIWLQNYGDNKKLFILLVREEETLIGIAPLMRVTEKIGNIRLFPSRQIRFIENLEAPHADFIITGKRIDVLQVIFNYLASIKRKWDIMILNNIPGESLLFSESLNLQKSGLRLEIQKVINNPILKPQNNWDSYFLSRSKRFRGTVRNSRNKIKKAGAISIENITSAQNGKPFLQEIWNISEKSWKGALNMGIARTETRQKFFSDLTDIATKNRWLSLWLLSKDQIPIAFEYHLTYKNKIYGLCSEFNQEYRKYSPGSVLDAHIVEKMFDNGVREYDMGPTEDFYKMRWTDTVRPHKVLYIFNSNFLSIFLYLLECKLLNNPGKFRVFIMSKNRRIEQVKKKYTTGGVKGLSKSAMKKIISFIVASNYATWFRRDLNQPIVDQIPKMSIRVQFEKREETLKWIKSFNKTWMYDKKENEMAIAENHAIAGIYHKRKIIGYIKIGHKKVYIQDFQKVITFRSGKAFIYDTFVLPEYRGLGVASYLITESMKYIKNKGFNQLLCHIPVWNTASIKAYKKVGFEAVKDIRFVKILGLSLFTSRPEKI